MSSAVTSVVEALGWRGRVVEEGSGPAVVVVGSMLVRAESYDTTRRALARRGFRAVVIEPPGCGRSGRVGRGWDFEQYAAWVEAVVGQLGLGGFTLVTHSNSGPAGMMLAARRADGVDRLVLVGSVGANRSYSVAQVIAGRAEDAFVELGLTAAKWHHVVLNVVGHWRNFWHQVELSARSDVSVVARDVKVPTLLAWGRHDHTEPVRCMRELRRVMPAARVYVSEVGSHDWIVDRAGEFAGVVEGFIGETGGGGGAPIAAAREARFDRTFE